MIKIQAQRLQHIAGTAAAGNRTVAVLSYRKSGSRNNERRCGRNIEGVAAIAAGSYNIYIRIYLRMDFHGLLAENTGAAYDFIDCLTLHTKSCKEACCLNIRGITAENDLRRFFCFF